MVAIRKKNHYLKSQKPSLINSPLCFDDLHPLIWFEEFKKIAAVDLLFDRYASFV
jgi:hypothetical protein